MKNFNFKFYFFRFKNVLAVLFVSFLVNSCKKDLNVAGIDSNATNPVSLEMQKWLTDQKFDSVKIISINNLRKKVQWDKANSILGDSSLSYDIAPMTLDTIPKFDDPSLTITKYLVFTKVNGIINNSAIIDLFGNKETLTRNYNKLIVSYYHKRQDSFTGIITINNIFGGISESKEYVAGFVKFKHILQARSKSNDKTILFTDKKKPLGCTDWFWCTFGGDGALLSAEYEGQTCDGNFCQDTSIIDHKAVQSIRSLCGGGGGGGGDGDNQQQDTIIDKSINNNPKLNCINSVLTGNTVFNALINAFVQGKDFTLKIVAGSLPSNITGKTSNDASYNSSVVTITLNNNTSNYSTATYVETFIHEAYHARIVQVLIQQNRMGTQSFNASYADSFDQYIAYQMDSTKLAYQSRGQAFTSNDEQNEQHNIISKDTEFIALGIKQAMEQMIPSLTKDPYVSWDTYKNYAWEGLEDSKAFKAKWGDDSTNPNPTFHGSINLLNQYLGCQ